jgi:uncharacterized small protein (DUF1192 family)
MADVEMNKGVQILLERMSSNPDEFIPTLRDGYPAKWRDILLSVEMRTNGGKDYKDQLSFLSDKEIKALWEKMQSLQGELFTKRVMDTLLRGTEDGRWGQTELSFSSSQELNESQKIELMKLEIERTKAEARLTNATARAFGR